MIKDLIDNEIILVRDNCTQGLVDTYRRIHHMIDCSGQK